MSPRNKSITLIAASVIILAALACATNPDLVPTPTLFVLPTAEPVQPTNFPGGIPSPTPINDVEPLPEGEVGTVTRVIDGDTIEVDINGFEYRVRYVGMNTPESDEPCFDEATQANADWVAGQTVTLIQDVSDTDQYGRLLRYVYVDGVMVNEVLVHDGWAEAVVYPPDDAQWEYFVRLEGNAAEQGLGCHPTGIFDDGSDER